MESYKKGFWMGLFVSGISGGLVAATASVFGGAGPTWFTVCGICLCATGFFNMLVGGSGGPKND
jgi:hypothetical protein